MILWLLYLGGYIASVVIIAGLVYAAQQRAYPTVAAGEQREDAGFALAFALVFGLIWPVMIPVTFCLSGFAHHGWLMPGTKL